MSDYKQQLISLFERVSGCSISEFSDEQLPYLADMIEGQMDADEACIDILIERLKTRSYSWISVDTELPEDQLCVDIFASRYGNEPDRITDVVFNSETEFDKAYFESTKYAFTVMLEDATHWMRKPTNPTSA